MTVVKIVENNKELEDILKLQEDNHYSNLTVEQKSNNGFVTVKHNFELLKSMNLACNQIIAVDNDVLVAYALVMLPEFKNLIPELVPMFELFDTLKYENKKIGSYKYYVMGQICIAASHRGKGLFDELYKKHKQEFSSEFDFCITEVSVNNVISMKAHLKTGFKVIHTYQDNLDTWNIMLWNWE